MMSDLANFDFKTATFGYRQETGSWAIDLGIGELHSVASFNGCVIKMVNAFLKAFAEICSPVEIRYNLIAFDAVGQIKKVQEEQVLSVLGYRPDQIVNTFANILETANAPLCTDLFIDCHVKGLLPVERQTVRQIRIDRAAQFYMGYVMEPNTQNQLVPTDSGLSFETSTDLWVTTTLDSTSLRWQDNHTYAAYNQPLLKSALQQWEKLVGQPIVEWSSRYYRNQIFQYGFKAAEVNE